eukprot:Pgem_evm1s10363
MNKVKMNKVKMNKAKIEQGQDGQLSDGEKKGSRSRLQQAINKLIWNTYKLSVGV